MGGKLNYERLNRDKRLSYFPAQRSQPATQKQLAYIVALCHDKGQPVPSRLPLTKKGASDMIERLVALPDKKETPAVFPDVVIVAPPLPEPTPTQEMVAELRAHFPMLTPMTVNSFVQLFAQIDPVGLAFVLNGLMHEDTPQEPNALILFIVERVLQEFMPVT